MEHLEKNVRLSDNKVEEGSTIALALQIKENWQKEREILALSSYKGTGFASD